MVSALLCLVTTLRWTGLDMKDHSYPQSPDSKGTNTGSQLRNIQQWGLTRLLAQAKVKSGSLIHWVDRWSRSRQRCEWGHLLRRSGHHYDLVWYTHHQLSYRWCWWQPYIMRVGNVSWLTTTSVSPKALSGSSCHQLLHTVCVRWLCAHLCSLPLSRYTTTHMAVTVKENTKLWQFLQR